MDQVFLAEIARDLIEEFLRQSGQAAGASPRETGLLNQRSHRVQRLVARLMRLVRDAFRQQVERALAVPAPQVRIGAEREQGADRPRTVREDRPVNRRVTRFADAVHVRAQRVLPPDHGLVAVTRGPAKQPGRHQSGRLEGHEIGQMLRVVAQVPPGSGTVLVDALRRGGCRFRRRASNGRGRVGRRRPRWHPKGLRHPRPPSLRR
jgi:hypothetical protein